MRKYYHNSCRESYVISMAQILEFVFVGRITTVLAVKISTLSLWPAFSFLTLCFELAAYSLLRHVNHLHGPSHQKNLCSA